MPTQAVSPVPDFLYGTAWKEDRTPALTELALRKGFRGIDTANQRRHYFEEGVGQGLAAAYRAGLVKRDDLFLQTKFTYQGGQDHRLPYDPAASLSVQVAQSMASSLDHLATDHVDSFVLHGPSSNYDWTDADVEIWEAMGKERDAGRVRLLGVSNVSLRHLQQMAATRAELPAFVQNRCYARLGWDRAVRMFCGERKIIYQGFDCESGGAAPSSDRQSGCKRQRHARSGRVQLRPRHRNSATDRHQQRRSHAAGSGQPRPHAPAERGANHRVDGRLVEKPGEAPVSPPCTHNGPAVTCPARPLRVPQPAGATSRSTALFGQATPSAAQIQRCVHAPAHRSGRHA